MTDEKIGVLGGGQLGKMLCQAASQLGIRLHILDKDDSFPAYGICNDFSFGNFKKYDDVIEFGKDKDIITVEIEAVNTEALAVLESQGKKVYPQPHILDLIKDKGAQKSFYSEHKLPTSKFELFENKADVRQAVEAGRWSVPFVQKSRRDGYDGQGVKIIKSAADLEELLDVPCLLEQLVSIDKELAVIVARNNSGQLRSFPVVEMEFHPTANLVEFLFSPTECSQSIQEQATAIAENLTQQLGIVGLLAVELFLTTEGELLINEVAPRPHNSGHHTIEANNTSQYEQHIRAILDLPLGNTDTSSPAVMVNILGDKEHKGPVQYAHVEEALAIEGAHLHLYGKAMTKPFRKMGHATITNSDLGTAKELARKFKKTLKVISK